MYEDLLRELRCCPDAEYGCSRCKFKDSLNCREKLMRESANAIEKLKEDLFGVNTVPAADVLEVVRCRDCKHRPVVIDESHPYEFGLACPKEGAYQDMTCPYLCDDGYYNRMPADDFYCAEGERRTDNV